MSFASLHTRTCCFAKQLFILLVFISTVWCRIEIEQAFIGKQYEYTCGGDPRNYTYSWTKRYRPFSSTGNIRLEENKMTILKPAVLDGALYSCKGALKPGSSGAAINEEFFLVINKPKPPPTFEISPTVTNSVITRDDPFKFKCVYEVARKTIVWQRWTGNKTESPVNITRDKISTVNSTRPETVEVYYIKKAKLSDQALYRCTVIEKNVLRATKYRVLYVNDYTPPLFDVDISARNIQLHEEDDLHVNLEPTGQPFPNITCFRRGKEVLSCPVTRQKTAGGCVNGDYELTSSYAFVVEGVYYLDHHGNYMCVATNPGGSTNVTFHVNVTVGPTIVTSTSAYIFESENKEGTVECVILEANPRPEVSWYAQLLRGNQRHPLPDKWTASKLKSSLSANSDDGYTSVLNVPAKHPQAFYMCNVTNQFGSDSRTYSFLRHRTGEKPISISSHVSMTMNEGEQFSVQCKVTIYVAGTIYFYRQHAREKVENNSRTQLVTSQDSTYRYLKLSIPYLWPNDTDSYECTSEQLVNQSSSVILTVRALRPAMISGLENQTAKFPEDRSVVMSCNVSGNPPPVIHWYNGLGPIKPSKLNAPNCKNLHTGFYFHQDRSELYICTPRAKSSGRYTCVAKNKLSNDSRSAYLYVSAPPDIKDLLQVKVLSVGEEHVVRCEATGNPPPLVYWMKNGEQDELVTDKSSLFSVLKISNMDESYVGNYTCYANNSRGTFQKRLLELTMTSESGAATASTGSMSTGSIVGIVVAIVVIVALAVFLILLWWRRQQKKLLFYKHQYFLKTGDYNVDPGRTLNEQSLNLTYDNDWEFPFERLVLGDRLGAGAFGEVYQAEAMGILALNPRDKTAMANKRRSKLRRSLRASQRPKKKTVQPDLSNATVAVKTLKGSATESEIRDLAAELKIMIHLGEHKNIVNLLGACTTGRKLYVILEFCPYGNLLSFLRDKREMYQSTWKKEVYDPAVEFTLIDMAGTAFQVAKGMEFLASKKLIHRDLAARNILVGNEYVMKISDFGLARDIYKDDIYVKTSSGLLPVKWMAIESLFERTYTHQSDVWSYGILLWEMMTLGGTPYPGLPPEELLDFLNNDKRMPQPANCPLEIYTIMRDCWNKNPDLRPTFSGLVEHLGRMLEKKLQTENPYLQIEASAEEMDAAREKDLLVKPKSDYYLEPLLLANKQIYDPNAPLPTPPSDMATPTYPEEQQPGFDTKPEPSKVSGSYARLKEPAEDQNDAGHAPPSRNSLDNESGISLDYVNEKNDANKGVKSNDSSDHVETVV